ncbi:MAG: AAA family ATPase [Planctomycetes bacterium]|nr:AAA family ATPase [Planctomycetota bacterium]
MPVPHANAVSPQRLRLRCEPSSLPFASTAEIEPVHGIVGQDLAVDALRFGLETDAPGHNVFVRGLAGSGRMTLIKQLLEEILPFCPLAPDHCYVHDFAQPEQPRLVTLPRGQGRDFGRAIDELIDFVKKDLGTILESEAVRQRVALVEKEAREAAEAITEPFAKELRDNQLALVSVQIGRASHPAIFPLHDGKPLPPEQFEVLRQRGVFDDEQARAIRQRIAAFSERLEELSRKVFETQAHHRELVRAIHADELRKALKNHARGIAERFPVDPVATFLRELEDDLVARFTEGQPQTHDFTVTYRVNVLNAHGKDPLCPILIETRPSLVNLMGTIEREWPREGDKTPDHLLIRAGSLLRANGGYLILDARDLLGEMGAWPALVRTLRSERLQIAPPEGVLLGASAAVKPEPIAVQVKVILVGDAWLYYQLDALDPDFPHLFKVLADFDTEIPRDARGIARYAGVLARVATQRKLPHFAASAVALLVEHGARIAGRQDRLTTRLGRLIDIAHEAAFLAKRNAKTLVDDADVGEAIARGRSRADLPARRFRERITSGAVRIQTRGVEVGQVNGLAVIQAGPLTFGFPSRITASIGAGTDGTISIERESQLSGAIHTKGFQILGGLLRRLLPLDHPLAFRAAIAFEQSYGGIDGDSASGAETVCLLSALTGLPARQDLAMTGAIDQLGHVQPIGAATQKIEGFFDVCQETGLTGTQGVIIPASNVGDLMLRRELVAAVAAGRFHVYAVDTIQEALALFLEREVGSLDAQGRYPAGSVLALAVERAAAYWRMVSARPAGLDDAQGGESASRGEQAAAKPAAPIPPKTTP